MAKVSESFRWRPTTAPPAGRYDDLWFVDESTGWAVNSNGQVLKTTNAGATWTLQQQLPGTYLRCLAMASPMKGWLGTTTAARRLYQTTDGGQTWTLVTPLPAHAPVKICGLSVVNEQVAYGSGTNVPGDAPGMIKTADGGATLTAWDMSAHATILIDCLFVDAARGWVVGGKANVANPTRDDVKPVVLYTEDGGATWVNRLAGQEDSFPFGEWGWKIQFLNDRIGFVSLENFLAGAILKTTDGGTTWTRLPVNDPQGNANLEGIGFLDENHGWVGGWGDRFFSSGKSSETTDGGQTWQDANHIGKFINRFRFIGAPVKVGFASGQTVYKYSTEPDAVAAALARGELGPRVLESVQPCECDDEHAIGFQVPPGARSLEIDVWDRFAAEVGSILKVENPKPGRWSVPWDFTDPQRRPLPPGQYLYRVTIDEFAESRLVTLRKRRPPRLAAAVAGATGGRTPGNVRKNIYDLTDNELGDFIEALLRLKRNKGYDQYPRLHRDAMARATPSLGEPFDPAARNSAHSGPVFLPWHREFIRRFELDLQAEMPGVMLPYWDWTADAALPDPTMARLWTKDFLGGSGTADTGYEVVDGPFVRAPWPIPEDLDGPVLRRRIGTFKTLRDGKPVELSVALPARAEVDELLNEREYDSAPWGRFAAGFRNRLEGWSPTGSRMHNVVHLWVGGGWLEGNRALSGSMTLATSPNDPAFFLHHCFVDKLWAEWQILQRQRVRAGQLPSESQPHYEPRQFGPPGHKLFDVMYPWELVTPASVLEPARMGYTYDTIDGTETPEPPEPGHDHHHLLGVSVARAAPPAQPISPFL